MVESSEMNSKGALGIDLGSYKAVTCHITSNSVDIVLSPSSDRSVPTQVAYTP